MDAAAGELERLIATAKVVEYLEPVMSKDLLFKFPDNSAFCFDYSQSSIWSPLIPRGHHIPADDPTCHVTPKKLSYGGGVNSKLRSARKKVAASAVKLSHRVMQSSRKKKKMNRVSKLKALDFSSSTPTKAGACVPIAAKGWNKVLKAASKQFKKMKKKKRRDPMAHVELSNYLEADNT